MSALSLALATSSGAPWADPLTPLDSALTDCCLSYKQNAPVSPLESALPNASHLLDSAHFETACFDTLASLPPVTPLESALTKNTGGGRESLRLSAPLFAFAICATWYLRASDLSAFAASPIGSSLVFTNLQIHFPATPVFSNQYKTPGVDAVLRQY